MPNRCETCPIRDFCLNTIQSEVAQITEAQANLMQAQATAEKLQQLNQAVATATARAVLELEASGASLGDVVESYTNWQESYGHYTQHSARTSSWNNILMDLSRLSIDHAEKRLAIAERLQGIVLAGCDLGPTVQPNPAGKPIASCNATGVDVQLNELSAIDLSHHAKVQAAEQLINHLGDLPTQP